MKKGYGPLINKRSYSLRIRRAEVTTGTRGFTEQKTEGSKKKRLAVEKHASLRGLRTDKPQLRLAGNSKEKTIHSEQTVPVNRRTVCSERGMMDGNGTNLV